MVRSEGRRDIPQLRRGKRGAYTIRQARAFHLPGASSQAVLDLGGDRDDLDPVHDRVAVVVRIERLGNQHLVARVACRLQRERKRFAPADGDAELILRERNAHIGVEPDQRFDRRRDARRRCVRQHVDAGVAHAVHERLRRRDVGLSDVQVIHVDAALLRRSR